MDTSWWLITGVLCIFAELVLPGLLVVWCGIAAFFVALLAFLGLNTFWLQLTIWITMSAILIVIVRKWFLQQPRNTREPDEVTGLTGVVQKDYILLDRAYHGVKEWRYIADEHIPEGSKVKVVGVNGNCLKVKTIKKEA